MKIIVISDIHGDISFLEAAKDEISSADLVIIAGDLSSRGDSSEAVAVIDAVESINNAVLAVHGNWDGKEVTAMLEERGYSLHGRGCLVGSTGFFGVGGSNKTPMNTPTEYSEDELRLFLQEGYSQVSSAERIVLVSHTPPRKTRDRTFIGLRGGSQGVRDFCEENRVDLCLCGHIHEAAGIEHLGGCLVGNPGSFKKGKYIIVEMDTEVRLRQGRFKKMKKIKPGV